MESQEVNKLVEEAYKIVDPRHGTPFEKSRTAFISLSQANGTITLSAFFARTIGLMSGDRIFLMQSQSNPLKWYIGKTRQRQGTKEIRITRGIYKLNSLELVKQIAKPFRFNPEWQSLIRLYVNLGDPIQIAHFDGADAHQLFDIPEMREDFASEEEKQEYINFLKENPYINKPKKQ